MELGDYDDDHYEIDYMADPIGEDCLLAMASPVAAARRRDGVDSSLLDGHFEDNDDENMTQV